MFFNSKYEVIIIKIYWWYTCVLSCEIIYLNTKQPKQKEKIQKKQFDQFRTLSLCIQPLYQIVSNKKQWITKIDDTTHKNPGYHFLKLSVSIVDMQADKLN